MKISNEYRVDENKLYLIGISLEVLASWNFGMQKPDLFAAIVPIAGGDVRLTIVEYAGHELCTTVFEKSK